MAKWQSVCSLPHCHTAALPELREYGSAGVCAHCRTAILPHCCTPRTVEVRKCGSVCSLPHCHTAALPELWKYGSAEVYAHCRTAMLPHCRTPRTEGVRKCESVCSKSCKVILIEMYCTALHVIQLTWSMCCGMCETDAWLQHEARLRIIAT